MEKNKIHVRICGVEYTLLSNEQPEYVHKVAYLVDKKMTEIMGANSKLNSAMASLLTAINLADEHFKSVGDTDNLRQQVAEYNKLSEAYKGELVDVKAELLDVKAELENANSKIEKLEAELEACNVPQSASETYDLGDLDLEDLDLDAED